MMPGGWSLRRNKEEKRRVSTPLPAWTTGAAQAAIWGELSDPSLYANQAKRYSRSDLVYMCVNRIAEMCALNAHRLMLFNPESERDPETDLPSEKIEDHPFMELWRRPNTWMSRFEFVEATTIGLQLNGNVYWHVDDGEKPKIKDGKKLIDLEKDPLNLWIIRPDRLKIKPSKEEYIQGYLYEAAGEQIMFSASAIRHHKRFHPAKDFEGLSPLEAANLASASDVAAQKSNFALHMNGMRLSMVVESERKSIDLDQMKLMEKMLLERYTGNPDKAHQVAFLWEDFKIRELGLSPRDAEFIESGRMNRMKVLGVFGVHPGLLFSEDVNLANAKIAEAVTLKFTVAPILSRLAGEITSMLCGENRLYKDAQEVEAHFVGVVKTDKQSDAQVAVIKSEALERLVRSLGPEEGIKEAKRQGLISQEVSEGSVQPITQQIGTIEGEESKRNSQTVRDRIAQMQPHAQAAISDTEQDIKRIRRKRFGLSRQRLNGIPADEWREAQEADSG